jgi:hypothetical protein
MTRKAKRKETALRREEVIDGYRRLAFGAGNDALRLLFCEEPPSPEELAALDIFNVSDVKRPKGGGLEIRFFDRCEAIRRLEAMDGESGRQSTDSAKAFYEAIARSVEGE